MKTLEYLDFHVAGEPFRLITSGFPEIIGSTMEEKRPMQQSILTISED